jgi:nitroreductase
VSGYPRVMTSLNDRRTPLSLLETRRSGRPRDMVAPGPSAVELEQILRIAARVPDHGKLAPWRFVLIEDRDAFAALVADAYAQQRPDAGVLEIKANDDFARQAPVLIAVLHTPVVSSKIPLSEQHLSAGAAILNLELAATALGYVAGWLTGWAATSRPIIAALGGGEADEVAGFVYLGTPGKPLEERPRPALADVVRRWPS